MAAEKVTVMVLEVDLQRSHCYEKIKKTLYKFTQIRDHVYYEKANRVAITVVCYSAEKIRDKLFAEGGQAIKSIEIKKPAKPREPEKMKPKEAEKPKVIVTKNPREAERRDDRRREAERREHRPREAQRHEHRPREAEKPKVVATEKPKERGKAVKPKEPVKAEKPKANGKGDKPKGNRAPPVEKPAEKPKNPAPKAAKPVKNANRLRLRKDPNQSLQLSMRLKINLGS